MRDRDSVRASYDTLANEYTRRIASELAHKPFDRELLDRFAERVRSVGQVYDVGCGPGHVADYLHGRGASVCGIDLSPAMVACASALYADIEFRVGDILALDAPGAACAGITAFYSLIHLGSDELPKALAELHRVLRPGGPLLIAFHVGSEVRHFDTLWDQAVDLDFRFFEVAEMTSHLVETGFVVESVVERAPYAEVEVQTQRCYIVAHRAGESRDRVPGDGARV
jgi:SAM-dependent methyltransferase